MAKDIVFHAIVREYNSRVLSLSRDRDRVNELSAQLAGLREDIIYHRLAITQLEEFAVKMGWDTKDLKK